MTPLRQRMIEDMVSAGLMASTQAAYIQAVRGLAAYYRRSPDELTEAEVRAYLLHLRDQRDVAHGTFQPAHAGLQFLFCRTLDRDWPLFSKKESAAPSASVCRPFCRTPRPAPVLPASGTRYPRPASC